MGEREVDLAAGDLLVVDNLKLHHVVDFHGFDTRAVVVSFRPEFVYSLGSPSHDYTFLLPFYSAAARRARVLPLPEQPEAADALRRLVRCRFEEPDGALQRAGCKAFLLEAPARAGAPLPRPSCSTGSSCASSSGRCA